MQAKSPHRIALVTAFLVMACLVLSSLHAVAFHSHDGKQAHQCTTCRLSHTTQAAVPTPISIVDPGPGLVASVFFPTEVGVAQVASAPDSARAPPQN
jgi:hypothetical protein